MAKAEDAAAAEGGASSTQATSTSQADREESLLKFAKCMRDQGVDFPDPTTDANGNLRFQPPRGGARGNRTALQAAMQKCQRYLAGARPQLSPEQQQQFQDQQLKFARCMRSHGVDVPDPQPAAGPGGGIRARIDPNDPATQAALKTCQKEVGGFGPGGSLPGGGAPPAGG